MKESNDLALDLALSFAVKHIKNGYFNPIMPLEKILSFVSVSLDGILLNDMRSKNSAVKQAQKNENIIELFDTLCNTVIIMLGGQNDKQKNK